MSQEINKYLANLSDFELGKSIDYGNGSDEVIEQTRTALQRNYIVKIDSFPVDKGALVKFISNFGEPMHGYRAVGSDFDNPDNYIGDVRIRNDIKPEDRFITEGNSELGPHTAKSWSVIRPQYFGLLMIDPGWVDQAKGMNGESSFVRVNDIIKHTSNMFPETFDQDIELILSTPVKFSAIHSEDDVADSPIVFPLDKPGTFGMRYRVDMRDLVKKLSPSIPSGETYSEAINKFDQAVQSAPHIETQLKSGELVLLDNRVVAHSRKPFLAEMTDDSGTLINNPRHLYNIHANAK